jgi:hypothetical protein
MKSSGLISAQLKHSRGGPRIRPPTHLAKLLQTEGVLNPQMVFFGQGAKV